MQTVQPDRILDSRVRHVEVDAARLLLILHQFARGLGDLEQRLSRWPAREVSRYLTPEYYLQKLDFLLRYPAHLSYELVELHRLGVAAASDVEAVKDDVRRILREREPELRTTPFRRFWHGAYENLDRVEAWWHARQVVYVHVEPRGRASSAARPQKYFFLTPLGEQVARDLAERVEHARWYHERVALIRQYFGALTPSELKELQYANPGYREAQLNEFIPDLSLDELERTFARVFGEDIHVGRD